LLIVALSLHELELLELEPKVCLLHREVIDEALDGLLRDVAVVTEDVFADDGLPWVAPVGWGVAVPEQLDELPHDGFAVGQLGVGRIGSHGHACR